MKKKIFSALKYTLFLGIGIFLTWWQLSKMTPSEWAQFKGSLLKAHYIVLVPVFILAILGHISRAMRWKILIEPMGYRPTTSNAFYAVMCGYLGNTFLPRVGEIFRCTLLSRYEKIPLTKLFGTLLLERIFDLFCYFLFIIITILIQIGTVSEFITSKIGVLFNKNRVIPIWAGILIVLSFAGIFLLIVRWTLIRYKNHQYVIKFRGLQVGLSQGFTTILHLKKRTAFIGHTLLIWATYLFEIYVGFSALSATSSLGIGAAFSVLSLATLAMIVSPGGLGAFPIAVQQVLLIYNVDNVSFGWLMWGVSTAIILLVGGLSFGLLIHQNRNKNEENRLNPGKDI